MIRPWEEEEGATTAARGRRSEIHHGITARALLLPGVEGGSDVHRRFYKPASAMGGGGGCDKSSTGPPCTGWLEMMVPVFSRAAWRCGWGRRGAERPRPHLGPRLQARLLRARRPDAQDTGVSPPSAAPTARPGPSGFLNPEGRSVVVMKMKVFDRRCKEAAAKDASWTDPYP
jgi:hypothetical protein